MKLKLAVLSILLVVLLAVALPAGAVTDGEPDGNGHPQVVLLLMDVGGQPAFRCSATMLSPTVVLTAGHCTNNYPDDPYTGMRIFTESDVQHGNNTYPFAGGPNSVEAVSWAAHPLYETGPFYLHDVGVVILAEPGYNPGVFGTLPSVDQFDAFEKNDPGKILFDAVGYGLQDANKNHRQGLRIRMIAHPKLIQINNGYVGGFSMLLSNNTNTGGTCFGDSGGANFLAGTNVVAGITSFGKNSNCAGTGGVFRTDRQDVLDFVNSFLH